MSDTLIRQCVEKALRGEGISSAEATELLHLPNEYVMSLLAGADRVRRAFPHTSPDRITIATDCGRRAPAYSTATRSPDASAAGYVSIPSPDVSFRAAPPATGTRQRSRRSMSL